MAVRPLLICGVVLSGLALLCLLISFASPYWLESMQPGSAKFVKLGLWEACFDNWSYYKDYMGKKYDGCWWIFSYEYRPIWSWLNPAWFLAIQVMITLTLLVQILDVVFLVLGLIGCCPEHRENFTNFLTSMLMFGSGFFIALSVIIFGVKAETDRQWIEHPDKNVLSWSFGFAVLSGFFSLFAGMCLLVEWMRVRHVNKTSRPREPYSAYAMKAPPPRYNY